MTCSNETLLILEWVWHALSIVGAMLVSSLAVIGKSRSV